MNGSRIPDRSYGRQNKPPFKWIFLGIVLLIVVLTAPHLLWIPVILGGVFGVVWVFILIMEVIFPPLTPEEKKEKERKLKEKERKRLDRNAIANHRASENKSKAYAKQMGREFKNPLETEGYVYAFRSVQTAAYRDYCGHAVKIGYTTKDPYKRAEELNKEHDYTDRIFEPAFWFRVSHCFEVEQTVHELLRRKKKYLWRELFDITEEEAKEIIEEAIRETDGAKKIKLIVSKKRIKEFVDAVHAHERPSDLDDEIPF